MMATTWDNNTLVEIQSRSVEKVLIPLAGQVSILVNNEIKERADRISALKVKNTLPNLELAICKFTSTGHEMGNINVDIRDEMIDACDATSKACSMIVAALDIGKNGSFDRNLLAESAKALLNAITRILMLADKTAVNKMVMSADKVDKQLIDLQNVTNFTDFVNAFGKFGGDMVELAEISGERQNDLKDELQRAEVSASRAILEKSTMMLLTTCKTCLRHPESRIASGNRNSVFENMRNAMNILISIIQDNEHPDSNISRGIFLDYKELEESIENSLKSPGSFHQLDSLLERLDNLTIDMDDVINVQNIDANKKHIIKQCMATAKDLQKQLRGFITGEKVVGDQLIISSVLSEVKGMTHDMMTELLQAAAERVTVVEANPTSKGTLQKLKVSSLAGNMKQVDQIGEILEDELQGILEISKLAKNVSNNGACIITAFRIEENLTTLLPQLLAAAKMLGAHPLSKITQENLEVFIDVWETQLDELTSLLHNITQNDVNGKEDIG